MMYREHRGNWSCRFATSIPTKQVSFHPSGKFSFSHARKTCSKISSKTTLGLCKASYKPTTIAEPSDSTPKVFVSSYACILFFWLKQVQNKDLERTKELSCLLEGCVCGTVL